MTQPDIILEARGVGKRFGGVRALGNIDFTLRRGELRCLIGPNGAGKSTFFKLLSGQMAPSEGDVLFDGRSIRRAQPHAIAQRGMGIKNQVPTVLDGLTVDENLWLAARSACGSRAARDRAEQLKARLGLRAVARRLVGELAHGQRQWVEIGMVVAREPKVILLDEPAAGMSDEETVRMAELILELNARAAVVVVEHDMAFIGRIARIVTVFHQGGILKEGSFAQIIADPRVRDVYLGRGAAHEPADGQPSVVRLWPHPGPGRRSLPCRRIGIPGRARPQRHGQVHAAQDADGRAARQRGRSLPAGCGHHPSACACARPPGHGVCAAGRGIFPGLSVLDNLRFSAKANPGRSMDVEEILAEYPRLKPLASRPAAP